MKKLRSLKAMREFLKGHQRYYTMNSWNGLHSFARNVKVQHLPNCPKEAYDFLQCEEAYFDVHQIIEEFTEAQGHRHTIGFNGRSSGYMVLYACQLKETGYKSYCTFCGQRNYEIVPEGQVGQCGRCDRMGRKNYSEPHTQLSVCSETIGGDIDGLESDEVRSLYALVYDFNKAVDDCIEAFFDYVRYHTMEEQTVMVPTKVMVPVEKSV